MKKVLFVLGGGWCMAACFCSPVWLTMTVLNLTGRIYRYDATMDAGTAGLLGAMMLAVWLLLVLVPCTVWLRKLYLNSKKKFAAALVAMAMLCVACLAVCRWDVVAVLTTPGAGAAGL